MPDLARPNRHSRILLFPLLVISIGLVFQGFGAWQDSLTNDEITHIAAGVSYWKTGDFRLNTAHPSLFKLWAALPLLAFPHLNLDTSSTAWKEAEQWNLGEQLVFHSSPDITYSRWIVFAARVPMIILWAAIGWMLYSWSRQRWNAWGGLITLSAYTFDPNFLGHGHLVNNDVALAGAFFATIWAAERLFQTPTWRRVWLTASLAALTFLMKFSGIFIYLVVGLQSMIFAWRRVHSFNWRWVPQLLLAGLVSFLAISWGAYLLTFGRPFQVSVSQAFAHHNYLAVAIALLTKIALPAPKLYVGIRYVFLHNVNGHPAFLLGHINTTGWWYYFPVAILAKTPLLTLTTFLVATGWLIRQHRSARWWTTVLIYALPPLLFLGWSMTSHINIGVRHVFPVYPFIFASLGAIATLPKKLGLSSRTIALGLSTGWLVVALIAGPHTLAYFNAAVGGTSNGHTILRDSNLDWQQDIWRLQTYVQKNHLQNVHMALNAATAQTYFFPDAQPIESDAKIAAGAHPQGTYAVSIRLLDDGSNHLDWLRSVQPKTTVGSTIRIYQF